MSDQLAPLPPITTVRNRRLSLWQSAVAHYVSEQGSPFMQVLNLPGMGDGAEVRLAMADGTLFAGANSTVRGLTLR